MRIETSDVLVLGGGVAAQRAGVAAAQAGQKVTMVIKGGGTCSAGLVGYNVAFRNAPSGDSPAKYFDDLMSGGGFLNNPRLLAVMAYESESTAYELEELGVPFDKNNGHFAVRQAAGSKYPRTIHYGDQIGPVAMEKLLARFDELGGKTVRRTGGIALIKDGEKVIGALAIDYAKEELIAYLAKATVLATGGLGYLYGFSTNPPGIVGDGMIMAYEAGATLMDMEFVQFEPFIFVWPENIATFSVPTTLVWDGARITNRLGEEFLPKDPSGKVKPLTKDVLSRYLYFEVREGRGSDHGGVFFDASVLPASILENYPRFMHRCRISGINPAKDAMEVAPAAHHMMGGVVIDENCFTGIPGLFAAGEVAAGVHGATRLAGAAGTDVLVFGKRAGVAAAAYAAGQALPQASEGRIQESASPILALLDASAPDTAAGRAQALKDLKTILWDKVGIVREAEGLTAALEEINSLSKQVSAFKARTVSELAELLEVKNSLLLARMIATSALMREESRGDHYRADFPERDDVKWLKNILVVKPDTRPVEPPVNRAEVVRMGE